MLLIPTIKKPTLLMNEKKKWKERFIGKQVIKPHQAKKDVNL